MKTTLAYCLLLVIVLTLPSCELGLDFLNPAGKTKTVERMFNSKITKIVVDDDVDLTIYINSTAQQRAIVTAGENLIAGIKTKVSDSTITVENTNTLTWTSSFKDKKEVTLYLNNNFSDLEYFGDGTIQALDTIVSNSFLYHCSESSGEVSLTLRTNNLTINQQSSVSDLRVFGFAENATVTYRGSGWMYLDQLVVNNMNITNHGSGDNYVNVLNNLTVTIESIGNIIYTGNPTISLTKNGSGNLIKH
jgi:Protein of unknown function (DUF2807).